MDIFNLLNQYQLKIIKTIVIVSIFLIFTEIVSIQFIYLFFESYSIDNNFENEKIIIFLKKYVDDDKIKFSIFLALVISLTLRSIFNLGNIWLDSVLKNITRNQISEKIFKNYLNIPKLYFNKINSSTILKNITYESENYILFISSVLTITRELFYVIFIIIFLSFLNFNITIFIISFFTFYSFLILMINKFYFKNLGNKRIKYTEERLRTIKEAFNLLFFLKRDNSIEKKFYKSNKALSKIYHFVSLFSNLPKTIIEFLFIIIITLIYLLNNVSEIDISKFYSSILTFAIGSYRIIPSVGKIIQNFQSARFNYVSAKLLNRESLTLDQLKIKSNLKKLFFEKKIILKNLTFKFDNKKNVIKNLNLRVDAGKKLGIFGPSGSGKTTLLNIIMGIYENYEGQIVIDNQVFSKRTYNLEQNFFYVPQHSYIAENTLENNIIFFSEKININKYRNAIKLSNLIDFEKNFLDISKNLGEDGNALSSGLKQRVGIARAIYKNPNILILDEATNSLDKKNEKEILDNLFKLFKKKTIIIVSHDINILNRCDKIFDLKNKKFMK